MPDEPRTSGGQSRRSVLGLLATVPLAAGGVLGAPGIAHAGSGGRTATGAHRPELEAKIQEILGRPEFSGATWALRYQEVGERDPVYALSPHLPMTPASAFKVFISGTAFENLGAEHRFHTGVYRTGPVVRGVLRGDLVLVAGGDLLLGGRIQPDGSLWLVAEDHSYGGDTSNPVPGDPIQSLRDLARQVWARGVRQIEGRVLVDVSLFREAHEQAGTGRVTVSPIMINDNIVDVVAAPGASIGDPAVLTVTPQLGYVDITNAVTTVAPGEAARPLAFADDVERPDGTHSVRLTGSVPLEEGFDTLRPYVVPGPARFAQLGFIEAMRDKGINVANDAPADVDPKKLAGHYTSGKQLAKLVSPPLSQGLKVMLKLSNNPHTANWPYVIGAVAGDEHDNPEAEYDRMRSALFEEAGLDPYPPGSENGLYSPDFFVQFLSHMTSKPYFRDYLDALPILGRDGTLAKVGVDLPVAGHAHAKTGGGMGTGGNVRALAGYIDLPRGRRVAFGSFIRKMVESPEEGQALQPLAMQALCELASAIYEEMTYGMTPATTTDRSSS